MSARIGLQTWFRTQAKQFKGAIERLNFNCQLSLQTTSKLNYQNDQFTNFEPDTQNAIQFSNRQMKLNETFNSFSFACNKF